MAGTVSAEPELSPALLDQIFTKLELTEIPTLDLTGLNRLYAAYCGHVSNDNIQKRIWLVGEKTCPVTGGDPNQFFETWLAHGTGGTCFPTAGGLCTILRALGFEADRVSGSVLRDGIKRDANHGSVKVHLDCMDYLVDSQHASFAALPIIPGETSTTGNGIQDVRAVPVAGGFELLSYPGANRQEPLRIQFIFENWKVDHKFFLEHYALSASRELDRSPFNDVLFFNKRSPEEIVVIGRGNKIVVSSDGTVMKTAISIDERDRDLIEQFGISDAIVAAIPPDESSGVSLI